MATGRVPITANSPLTAKGDLFTYDTNQARLPVGSNGETLLADSAATTGLRWQGNYAAGKNKIINADFNNWQRGTSFTNPTASAYTADRFSVDYSSGTVNCVISQQAFTPGTAPVSGYESQYFVRIAQSAATSGKSIFYGQKIEDVRTFAGQTITFSFFAKANANKTLTSRAVQSFGSGGSGAVSTSGSANSITTSWARYYNTITIPSVSGKTIGAGSFIVFDLSYDSNAIQDIDLWGFQVESGSVATPFSTATGTLQGELAACQRYYYATNAGIITAGIAPSSVFIYGRLVHPVEMRTTPSGAISASGTTYTITDDYAAAYSSTTVTGFGNDSWLTSTASRVSLSGFTGLTTTRFYSADGRAAGQIFFSAEL